VCKQFYEINLDFTHSFAFVRFDSTQEARGAFDKSKDLKIGDSVVNVSYARGKS